MIEVGPKLVLFSCSVLICEACAVWKINFQPPIIPTEPAPCIAKAITPIYAEDVTRFPYTLYLIVLPSCLSSSRVLWNLQPLSAKIIVGPEGKFTITQVKVQSDKHIPLYVPIF